MMYIQIDNVKYIIENDYLKVCEEKDKLRTCLNNLQIQDENKFHDLVKYEKELKDKKDFIEKQTEINVDLAFENKEIKQNNEVLLNLIEKKNKEIDNYKHDLDQLTRPQINGYHTLKEIKIHEIITNKDNIIEQQKEMIDKNNYVIEENCKLRKEIERLKNLYEPEKQYEEWCDLVYCYKDKLGNKKLVEHEMLLEDAYELIGMDSDNWSEFKVYKYKKEVK